MLRQIEPSAAGPSSQYRRLRRAPDRIRHPVVSEDRNPGSSHIADCRLHVGYLLVTARQAQHRLVIETDGHIFQADQPQASSFGAIRSLLQVFVFPLLFAGEAGRVHQEIIGAQLLDERQFFVGQLVELA